MPRRKEPVKPRRGVIYGRQSLTKEGSESLDTQVERCVATADHHGVELVDTILEPPSTSAYKDRGRQRPRFPEVLELIRSGAVDCVVAYKTDRLSRGGGIGWAPLVEAAESAGLDVDRFVLIAGSGFMSEFEIGIRATMDREESRKTSDRLRDMRERQAASLRPYGGGRHPFGYRFDATRKTYVIEPDEAAMIRDAVERVLAGEGTNAICRDWNDTDRLTRTGALWRPTTLRRTLTRPAIAGLRTHNDEVIGAGDWEPIIDRATWEKVRARLLDPARAPVPSYRENVLSRIIRCDICKGALSIVPIGGRDRFHCHPTPGTGRCGGVNVTRARVEEVVFEAMFQRLDSPTVTRAVNGEPISDDADLAATIETGEARLIELAEMWAGGNITRAEYFAARTVIEQRLDQARSRLRRRAPALALPTTSVLRAEWEKVPADGGLSLDHKRQIVRSVIARVWIRRAPRGPFDPDRVHIEWKS